MSKKLAHPFLYMGHIKHIHFIGISGVGMSGIAEVLISQGYQVSGSDLHENSYSERLLSLGATIFIGHRGANIDGADVVVRSSAVPEDNIEVLSARQHNIPIVSRAEMLGELMRFKHGIAIAGTHGKTTTTSLVTAIFANAQLDPTFVIGGQLNQFGTTAKLGSGKYLIAEADESDASFLYLNPMISVITNIDADHMETYQHDFAILEQTFLQFLRRLPFYGLAVLCVDDPVIRKLLPQVPRFFTTYGFTEEADFFVRDISICAKNSCFIVERKIMGPLTVRLNLPGKHNILNSLAAIAIATKLNIPDECIIDALANFSGVNRRLEIYENIVVDQQSVVTVVDDYGHHPQEIRATLSAISNCWPTKRKVMIYQPHRYTRTKDLFNDFVQILAEVDLLLLLEVYAANELPITGASSNDLISSIKNHAINPPILVFSNQDLPGILSAVLLDQDILILQGAGDIGDIAARLIATNLTQI